MINILDRITSYRTKKGWTEYQLAEESGLTQSTISSWYRKNLVPSIPSLEKICQAFGITLAQFFSTDETSFSLTPVQRTLLEEAGRLSEEQQLHKQPERRLKSPHEPRFLSELCKGSGPVFKQLIFRVWQFELQLLQVSLKVCLQGLLDGIVGSDRFHALGVKRFYSR